jgi:hypothetical protein
MHRTTALAVSLLLPACVGARSAGLVGAYTVARIDAPLVLQAREAIQKHFSILRLGEVLEASTQVVAGTQVKLVCQVTGEAEPSRWQFVIWQKLDQTWQLQSCARVSPAR